jgi:hypothetical protein
MRQSYHKSLLQSMVDISVLLEKVLSLELDVDIHNEIIEDNVLPYEEKIKEHDPNLYDRIKNNPIHKRIDKCTDDVVEESDMETSKLRREIFKKIMKVIHPDKNKGDQHKYHNDITKANDSDNLGRMIQFAKKLDIDISDLAMDEYREELREKYKKLLIQMAKIKETTVWKYSVSDDKDAVVKSQLYYFNTIYPPPKSEQIRNDIDMYTKLMEDDDGCCKETYMRKICELAEEMTKELELENEKMRKDIVMRKKLMDDDVAS